MSTFGKNKQHFKDPMEGLNVDLESSMPLMQDRFCDHCERVTGTQVVAGALNIPTKEFKTFTKPFANHHYENCMVQVPSKSTPMRANNVDSNDII